MAAQLLYRFIIPVIKEPKKATIPGLKISGEKKTTIIAGKNQFSKENHNSYYIITNPQT
jgi:hypothetical protein